MTLSASERRVLLTEARAQARERVLSLLVDELTEDMLTEMREELTPRLRPARGQSEETEKPALRAAEPAGHAWYVYGVIEAGPAGPPESVPGIDPDHATTTVAEQDLAAIVSRVPLADFGEEPLRERLTDMEWLERTARVHEQVLELAGRGRTLIPMRICSIYRDQSGIREMLRREADGLQDGLAHLRGRTEWGVKVFADRVALARQSGPDEEGAGEDQANQGTAYLRRRRHEHRLSERADQELEERCQEIHSGLAAIAADARTLPVQRPEVTGHPGEMILNGAYLVADEAYGEFVAEVDRLSERFSGELIPTGPWPAYNFVPGTLGAAL